MECITLTKEAFSNRLLLMSVINEEGAFMLSECFYVLLLHHFSQGCVLQHYALLDSCPELVINLDLVVVLAFHNSEDVERVEQNFSFSID